MTGKMATKRKSVSGVKSDRPAGQRAISAFFGSQPKKSQVFVCASWHTISYLWKS